MNKKTLTKFVLHTSVNLLVIVQLVMVALVEGWVVMGAVVLCCCGDGVCVDSSGGGGDRGHKRGSGGRDGFYGVVNTCGGS